MGAVETSTHRDDLRAAFLSKTPWKFANIEALKSDASRRRYFRLVTQTQPPALLMDAPYELGEDVRPFLNVGRYLRDHGINAPQVFENDLENGFLILEDFGDSLFDQTCAENPHMETQIYEQACDVLIHLARLPKLQGLEDYRPQMPKLGASAIEWYAAPILERDCSAEQAELLTVLDASIQKTSGQTCTILRDFHAQNLIWLDNREGHNSVGVLDFQDAMVGPIAYDLVSLMTDARRQIDLSFRQRIIERFRLGLGLNTEDLDYEISVCSVQRNLRILMVFARMSLLYGRTHYLGYIPRVWDYLFHDLQHPELKNLRSLIEAILPKPTSEVLTILERKCGTMS